MPELPEVETVRRDLKKYILGKKIVRVEVRKKKIVRGVGSEEFKKYLEQKSFSKIDRRGKLLIFRFEKGPKMVLLVHLKMTGQLIYRFSKGVVAGGHTLKRIGKLPGKHSHIILDFEDNSKLFFNDLRQFGYWTLVDRKELGKVLNGFGVESLMRGFSKEDFRHLVWKKKKQVKAFLLDQSMIAGIGNIYADEICFGAGIHPGKKLSELNPKKIDLLYEEIKKVLKMAVKERGTTISDFVDLSGKTGGFLKFLKVYGKEGEICPVCKKGKIKKIRLAGRGTRFCPVCQT